MSEKVDPFLKASDDLCLICNEPLGNDYSVITKPGWPSIKAHAKAWNDVPLAPGNVYFEFTQVHSKVDGREEPFGKRHKAYKCIGRFSRESLREKLSL